MLDVLDFMYRGEANVKKENLAAFLRLAENLKVKGLADNDEVSVFNLICMINNLFSDNFFLYCKRMREENIRKHTEGYL